MEKFGILLAVFAVTVCAQEKCGEKGKCPAGKICIGGNCIGYLDCPPVIPPSITPECKMYLDTDEKGCPKMVVVCDQDETPEKV